MQRRRRVLKLALGILAGGLGAGTIAGHAFTLIGATTLTVTPSSGQATASFAADAIYYPCPTTKPPPPPITFIFYWDKPGGAQLSKPVTVSGCTTNAVGFGYDTGKVSITPPGPLATVGPHNVYATAFDATGKPAPMGTSPATPYKIDPPRPPPSPTPSPTSSPTTAPTTPPPTTPPPTHQATPPASSAPTSPPTPTPQCTIEGPAHGCVSVDCTHLTASLPTIPTGMPSLLLGLLLGGGSAALVFGPGIRRRRGRWSRFAALLGFGGLLLATTACARPAAALASPTPPSTHSAAGFEATPDCRGYWIVADDGGIYPMGSAAGLGSTGRIRLNKPIVGMDATPDGGGYWLVASDGGIFPFGDAVGYGSTGAVRLNKPIVAMESTADGAGYWLVASEGGIFPFGDAGGYGSTGSIRLDRPIVDMEATPDSRGYWLVASDGGIFPFGDAGGFGSTGAIRLNQPIVGMEATPDGGGYWLVASDGGIFPFGDAVGYGSTGAIHLNKPIVGMEETPDGHGYWLFASDGGVFPFGDAPGYGAPHLGP